MQCSDRNVVVLGDIGDDTVVGLARHQQVGAVGQFGQRPAHLGPALDEQFLARLGKVEGILRLGEVTHELRDLVDLYPGVRPVRDAGQSGGLDESNEVGWDRHRYVVSAPLQLHPHCGTRFDIAARAMHRQHEFHRHARTSGGGQLVEQQISQASRGGVDVGGGDAYPGLGLDAGAQFLAAERVESVLGQHAVDIDGPAQNQPDLLGDHAAKPGRPLFLRKLVQFGEELAVAGMLGRGPERLGERAVLGECVQPR